MQDDLNFFENGRQPQLVFLKLKAAPKKKQKKVQPETFKINTMVVAPLRVT